MFIHHLPSKYREENTVWSLPEDQKRRGEAGSAPHSEPLGPPRTLTQAHVHRGHQPLLCQGCTLFIDRETKRHLSGFRGPREFPVWIRENFYTVPKHSFLLFLTPKLERKQIHRGLGVAGKRNPKVKTFHKKSSDRVYTHLA